MNSIAWSSDLTIETKGERIGYRLSFTTTGDLKEKIPMYDLDEGTVVRVRDIHKYNKLYK